MSWACSNSLGHGAAVIIHIWCHCCPKLWLVLLSKLKYISQSSGQSGSCKLIMKENCKDFQVLDRGRESQRTSYIHLIKQWWVRKLHIDHETKPQRFSGFRHRKRILTEEWGFQGLIELNIYLLSIACYDTRGNNHATKIGWSTSSSTGPSATVLLHIFLLLISMY